MTKSNNVQQTCVSSIRGLTIRPRRSLRTDGGPTTWVSIQQNTVLNQLLRPDQH